MQKYNYSGPERVRQALERREERDWINWLKKMLFVTTAVAAMLAGTLLAVAQAAGLI